MTDLLARVRAVAAEPDFGLPAALRAETDQERLAAAGRLLAGVPADRLAEPGTLRPLRVAVVGTFTADRVPPLLRVCLLRAGIAPELLVTGFDQLVVQLTDPESELARFAPDVTLCLLHDDWFLPADRDPTDFPALEAALDARLDVLRAAVTGFAQAGGSIVLHTVPLARTESDSVIAYRAKARLGRTWRRLNIELLRLGESDLPVYTLDLEAAVGQGAGLARDERLYRFAGMAWTAAVEGGYAELAARFCRTVAGLAKKVLVLDLDNTLWGGTVGDDGPAGVELGPLYPGNAYQATQRAALALRRQGVLLAICSKNEESVVDELLAGHPEQVLRAEDFAARAIDWQPKDGNVGALSSTLNLALDSVVFADDSPFECDLVRQSLPEVTVIPMTGDPAEHAGRLLADGHFDTLDTTATDRSRTESYLASARRDEAATAATSLEEYLGGLGIRVAILPVDEYTLPRVIQLGLRANQFNMVRGAHSEATTRRLAASRDHLVLGFEVSDRFGREGVVGGVWIAMRTDHWLVENFVMSCRVMARGVEQAVLHHVFQLASAAGVGRVRAEIRPNERNRPAQEVYPAAGFEQIESREGTVRYEIVLPSTGAAPEWITVEGQETVHA
ncbi:HAD-IIIC family phosphatase [Amycolatopsis mediterranei]|uniref:HAD-IIIC family phosphatase n=1 Tax=Amycolatopsis mediterranei TaxID=33910 RepID=UPI003425863A